MATKYHLLINNEWVSRDQESEPLEELYIPVINPATEEIIAYVTQATDAHVSKAIESSTAAFAKWKNTPVEERAACMNKLADKLQENMETLATMETQNNGKTYFESIADIDECCNVLRFYASLTGYVAQKEKQTKNPYHEEDKFGLSHSISYEPIGACVGILPFNYPLMIALWKMAPAIITGCTIILKPSEYTSLTTVVMGEYIKEIFPAGVINILTGYGYKMGNSLTSDPRVKKVSFTGSLATGLKVASACQPNLTRCNLELGGKSSIICFDDCDIDSAVGDIIAGIFSNKGEICSATSRLLVQKSIYQTLVDKLVEKTNKIVTGDSLFDKSVSHGAQVCKVQYEKVLNYINIGKKEGATVLTGGGRSENIKAKDTTKGFFIAPTIFANVTEDMTVWKEEIFGPVLCVMPFETDDEALRMANNTQYGLAASVMTANEERLTRFNKELEVGTVWLNCCQPCLIQCGM